MSPRQLVVERRAGCPTAPCPLERPASGFHVRQVPPGLYVFVRKALGARSGFVPGSKGFDRARPSADAA